MIEHANIHNIWSCRCVKNLVKFGEAHFKSVCLDTTHANFLLLDQRSFIVIN